MGQARSIQAQAVAPAPAPARAVDPALAGGVRGYAGAQDMQSYSLSAGSEGFTVSKAPPRVHDVLRSSGEPLEPGAREFFEQRLGHDFANLRVHAGFAADEAARSVQAQAFTVGSHVVFGSGRYEPNTAMGRNLLAHELQHVIQQRPVHARPVPDELEVAPESDPLEREAHAGASVLNGGAALSRGHTELQTPVVQRLGFGFELLRFFGIEAGTFSNADLREYLDRIAEKRRCDCGTLDFLSDDMAREIIARWGVAAGKAPPSGGNAAAAYSLDDAEYHGVPTTEIKRILIQELLDGPTSGSDETAIITVFRKSSPDQVLALLDPTQGLSIQAIESDVSGDNLDELRRVLNVKVPGFGEPNLKRNEKPGDKSGDCTVSRALQIGFAHKRAEALVTQAIALLDEYVAKPEESRSFKTRLDCYFNGPSATELEAIRSDLQSMLPAFKKLLYACPAEPFTGYTQVNEKGERMPVNAEPDTQAIAFTQKPPAAAADAAKERFSVALFPDFFTLSPSEQARIAIHECLHHAKRQDDRSPETYGPKCRALSTKEAMKNADSYAQFVMALQQQGPKITTEDDCPAAWKPKIVAAVRTGERWVGNVIARLDEVLASPKTAPERISQLLQEVFKIQPDDKAHVQKMRDVFANMQNGFTSGYHFHCDDQKSGDDTLNPATTNYWVLWSTLTLHADWFAADDVVQVETMVHEAAHFFAGRRGEEVYWKMSPRAFNALSTDEAFENADSFAQFAKWIYNDSGAGAGGAAGTKAAAGSATPSAATGKPRYWFQDKPPEGGSDTKEGIRIEAKGQVVLDPKVDGIKPEGMGPIFVQFAGLDTDFPGGKPSAQFAAAERAIFSALRAAVTDLHELPPLKGPAAEVRAQRKKDETARARLLEAPRSVAGGRLNVFIATDLTIAEKMSMTPLAFSTEQIFVKASDIGDPAKLQAGVRVPLVALTGGVKGLAPGANGRPEESRVGALTDELTKEALLHELLHVMLLNKGLAAVQLWQSVSANVVTGPPEVKRLAEDVLFRYVRAQEEVFVYTAIADVYHGFESDKQRYELFAAAVEAFLRSAGAEIDVRKPVKIDVKEKIGSGKKKEGVSWSIQYSVPKRVSVDSEHTDLLKLLQKQDAGT